MTSKKPKANESDDLASEGSTPSALDTDSGPAGLSGEDGCIRLPELVDFAACEDLAARIDAARSDALEIDASKVGFLGTLGLQLLLSAQSQWQRDKAAFSVTNPSSGFLDGLKELGVPGSVFDS